ncbi:MAG: GreA/GreB family elongation factor [Verrucomicrobia bacterium]|nr:GreA/GreB family elongation factor [Verrucomicrobiota bacterium]
MHPDLQSLVSAGKLTSQTARALEALPPGTFCQHKSWGFGRVAEWRPDDDQILIDFGPRKAHPMKLAYAAETVQPVPPEHLLARKAQDPAGLKKQAQEDPAEVVRLALQHAPGGKMTPVQLGALLAPEVFAGEAEFKRWWDGAGKRALKAAGNFTVPLKKTDPIVAHGGGGSVGGDAAAGLLQRFKSARQNKEQLNALDAIAKEIERFRADPAALTPVLAAVGTAALQAQRLSPARAIELLCARNEIAAATDATLPEDAPQLEAFLRLDEADLAKVLDDLPAARQRTAIAALPAAFGEDKWPARVLTQLPHTRQPRVVGEVVGLFEKRGRAVEVAAYFDRVLRDYTISCEMLLWLCREHGHDADKATTTDDNPFAGLLGRVFGAALSALDRDRFGEVKRGTRLRDLLLSDRALASALLAATPPTERLGIGRALLASPAFEELDRRSLMGRLIKSHPELGPLLGGGEKKDVQPLVVSWASLEKRKEEYDKLVNKDIPKNSQEIGLARSYGDLRENFEFKAAKEMQTVLMRRKAELEIALARARGTSFENPDLTQVSIGTVIRLKDKATGQSETYTILGAWDGDPERHLISYQTAIGQALLGRRVGETIALPGESANSPAREVLIEDIQAYHAAAVAAV